MEVKFSYPTSSQIAELAEAIRPEDWEECKDAGFSTPLEAVQLSVEESTECWCATWSGDVLAIFGVRSTDTLCGSGVMWLLTSTLVESKKKTFTKYARRALRAMLSRWRSLRLGIGNGHPKALRFAYRSGFTPGHTYMDPRTGKPFTHHVIGD